MLAGLVFGAGAGRSRALQISTADWAEPPTAAAAAPAARVTRIEAQGRVGAEIVGPRRTTRWWFEPGRLGATVEVLEDGVLRTHRLSD